MSEAALQMALLLDAPEPSPSEACPAPPELESGVHAVAEALEDECDEEAEADARAARACFVAGHMPDLPPLPASTPGYRPPEKRLPPDHVEPEDLSGRVYGFLRVKRRLSGARYLCVCERPWPSGAPCGGEAEAHASQLRRGERRSCGCGSNYKRGLVKEPST